MTTSKPEPVAYIYERKIVGDPGFTDCVSIPHPQEMGLDEADSVEYQNVRQLVEADCDE